MNFSAKTTSQRTICEVLREIYDITEGNREVTDRLQDAYVMAKKMDAKLRQFHGNYDQEWWETELDQVKKAKIKKRKARSD